MKIPPSAVAAMCNGASYTAKRVSDEEFAKGPISSPPPGHFDPMPPAEDSNGLVSPAGRLRRGVFIYLQAERFGPVIELTSENPWTGAEERGVLIDYNGGEEYRPEWAVIRNFRVREDGQ